MIDIETTYAAAVAANFTHTNVSDITADPLVKTREEYQDGGFSIENGVIVIVDVDYRPNRTANKYYNEEYFLDLMIKVEEPLNRSHIKEIAIELDRIYRVLNTTAGRTEEYYIVDDFVMNAEYNHVGRIRIERDLQT